MGRLNSRACLQAPAVSGRSPSGAVPYSAGSLYALAGNDIVCGQKQYNGSPAPFCKVRRAGSISCAPPHAPLRVAQHPACCRNANCTPPCAICRFAAAWTQ
jgi:hypothetical protein